MSLYKYNTVLCSNMDWSTDAMLSYVSGPRSVSYLITTGRTIVALS